MLLVLDGDVGVLMGDLGGGIFGFEARSSASLNTEDISGDISELPRWKNRYCNSWSVLSSVVLFVLTPFPEVHEECDFGWNVSDAHCVLKFGRGRAAHTALDCH
jgi:hypothetical protein